MKILINPVPLDSTRLPIFFRREEGLSFDDVLLVPRRGILLHRANASLTTNLSRRYQITVPIISAPMSSVTEHLMAIEMYKAGGMGFIHRANNKVEQSHEYFIVNSKGADAVCAIGINEGLERIHTLNNHGCWIFCIDVAHAHSERVGEFIEDFNCLPNRKELELIVGNVATWDGALFLAELGVDAIKVGIGPGAACTTREVTGFGMPQLSAIMECYQALNSQDYHIPIIADGGIKNSGDIIKALAAGASSVMLGRLLAGADEAPYPGEYFGMASKRVNQHNAPEGVEGNVEKTGPVLETLKKLIWGIRSGISYAGVTSIHELQENAEFIRVAPHVIMESGIRL